MSRRSQLGFVAVLQKTNHTVTVRLQYLAIVCFRELILGKPPDELNSVFDSNSSHVDPLGWCWQLCGIVLIEILSKSKMLLLTQIEQQLVSIERLSCLTFIPTIPNVND